MTNKFTNLALVANSGVSVAASYAGLSTSMETGDVWWLALAAMIAGASGIAIYVFWRAAFEAAVTPERMRFRGAGWAGVFAGALFILGMSSYWNVAGIAANQVRTIALQYTVSRAETSFARALRTGGNHQAFIPRITSFRDEIGSHAECEGSSGCVTGSPGKQGVYQTLIQLRDKAQSVLAALKESHAARRKRVDEGRACLADMRGVLNGDDGIAEKEAGLSKALDCVNGVIADIGGPGPLNQIAQSLEGFTAGVIMPVTVKTKKQKMAVANILDGLKKSAGKIAEDAGAAIRPTDFAPLSLARLSPMKAVIVHYDSLLPQWVTGIGLDLLPLILIWFNATITADRRFRPHGKAYGISVGEMIDMLKIADQVREPGGTQPVTTIDITPEKPETDEAAGQEAPDESERPASSPPDHEPEDDGSGGKGNDDDRRGDQPGDKESGAQSSAPDPPEKEPGR